ncbi:MAG: methylated-DNA--[protein]-cysteine S-methyltransferase [Planctomycetota bacterium]|nr:methylated-DNA--[protein]-cysteine S-methyltransferase [Planctomycetota bacterium]
MSEPLEVQFRESHDSPIGKVWFSFSPDGELLAIDLPGGDRLRAKGVRPRGAPTRPQVGKWLSTFMKGAPCDFPGPWRMPGHSPFMSKVYRYVGRIPVGHTKSYSEVAQACGSPRACRAVGTAMAQNPMPLLVPCHRVLAKDGMGGFAGGLEQKADLLAIEAG